LIRFLLAHRAAALVALLLLTLLSVAFILKLRVDPGAESVLPSGGKTLKDLRRFNATFGGDETLVVALHSPGLFSDAGLARMDALTWRLTALPHVSRVLSPTNLRDIQGDELGPFPVIPYEQVRLGKWSAEEMGRRLASHPLFGDLLVSRDATTAALLIELPRSEAGEDYRARLVAQVRTLAAREARGMTVHVAGLPVEKADVAEYVKRDQRIFAPLILGLLALVTLALYRHPSGAIVALGVVCVSLLWTLGLYAATGRMLNPVTSLITPVILVVAVAGAIHLLNHHLAARGEGLAREAALERAIALSWLPCFNASLTTAIGFGSLLVLPLPAIRDFGIFTALGVMISYFLTITLAPLLIAVLPDFPARVASSFTPGRIERFLRSLTHSVASHPFLASAGTVAVLTLSILGVYRIRIETDLLHSLRRDSPLAQATEFIDRHLTGVNSLEIIVHGAPAGDPEALARVEAFEEEIRKLPGVRKVTGFPDLVRRVNRAFHEGRQEFEALPEGPEAASDVADIQDQLRREAPEEMRRFVAADGSTLRLTARVAALDTGQSQRLFARIRKLATASGVGGVTLTGNFAVLSDMSTSLVRNQLQGLLPALALILATMMLQSRSLRLGLISAIPTAAPVLMTYGLMGWIGIPLSVPTAMIASIAMGMTDDNTIHLLARFKEEFARDRDYEVALEAMMDSSGRAVVYSTLTVAIGFCVGAFSSFLPSRHFALLTGATLLLGLFCEAVLLPLALVLFKPLGAASVAGKTRVKAAGALGVFLCFLAASGYSPALGASTVMLKDQYGRRDGIPLHRGAPLILIYGKPTNLRRMKSWETKLREKAGPSLQVLRALDARAVRGKKTEAEVNERLQGNVPKEIAILVDWNGALQESLALPDAEVSVALLDAHGVLCRAVAGTARDQTVAQMLDSLAEVREKGRCP
jgi:predicted RND superfamily exporter protein